MNVRSRKVMAVIVCICFMIQIIFRSFSFDSMATPSNTVIALIFRDTNGYHIRNISSFLDIGGTITMPTPRDLGDTNDESYSNWSPVLIENSFDNVKKVIMNGGHLDIEDYDVSNPPTLATSSVATPSLATSANSQRTDIVIRSRFLPLTNEESANANITIYRSNVLFGIGSTVHIARRGRLNVISDGMKQFVSKNGNKNQIFFLAVQPPVEEVPESIPNEVPGITLSTEESRPATRAENNTVGEVSNNAESTGSSRGDSNIGTTDIRTQSTNHSTGSSNIRTNVSSSSERNNTTQSTNVSVQNSSNTQGSETRSDNLQSGNTQSTNTIENNASSIQSERVFTPMGNGIGHSVYSSVKPRVSIHNESSQNNGFLNTKSTSVNVSDDNFNADNYSVLVYKNVGGKEVLSNARYSWSQEGGNHKANILFDDDGEYRISVVKNNAKSQDDKVKFEQKVNVDSTAPYITITGVEDLTANARTVSPVVKYSDVNIDLSKSKITLTSVADGKVRELLYKAKKQGSGYILNLDPIYIDDNYVLTVTIYDMAGNVTEKKVNFSVNKNGATFKFKPEELVGQYTNKPFTPSIEVWNTDEISIVSATINGTDEPYEFVNGELKFLKSIDRDGKYTFNLEVIDTAGNKSSMKPVEIIYDATKPVSMILGVEEGQIYEGNVNIILSTELPGDFIESVWLDDKLLDKSEYTVKDDGTINLSIYKEGKHTIKAQGKDKAGNLSDIASVSFEIKAPKAKLLSTTYIPLAVITLGIALGLGVALIYKKRKEEQE